MATLRPVEERDSKGNTTRMNPAITWKQDPQVRLISGRHDFRFVDNPDYHPVITAQVQGSKVVFFHGTPDTSQTRAAAREIPAKDVPAYILDELDKHPMKVREARPTVYEVRVATVGDVEVTETVELVSDGQAVTVEPVAPDLTGKTRRRQSQAHTAQPVLD
jgi:hypothetical protein